MCLAQLFTDRHTVPAGQHDIEDNDIERSLQRQRKSLFPVIGKVQRVSQGLEIVGDVFRDIAIVFYDQNFHLHPRRSVRRFLQLYHDPLYHGPCQRNVNGGDI